MHALPHLLAQQRQPSRPQAMTKPLMPPTALLRKP
jgi:hypothetical protein